MAANSEIRGLVKLEDSDLIKIHIKDGINQKWLALFEQTILLSTPGRNRTCNLRIRSQLFFLFLCLYNFGNIKVLEQLQIYLFSVPVSK